MTGCCRSGQLAAVREALVEHEFAVAGAKLVEARHIRAALSPDSIGGCPHAEKLAEISDYVDWLLDPKQPKGGNKAFKEACIGIGLNLRTKLPDCPHKAEAERWREVESLLRKYKAQNITLMPEFEALLADPPMEERNG